MLQYAVQKQGKKEKKKSPVAFNKIIKGSFHLY